MKKAGDKERDEMRPEYDLARLKGRVRGKHYKAVRAGTNLVLLEPDVAKAFPDAASVNEALRLLVNVAKRQPGTNRGSRKKGA
jgi:hypothetical protein